MLLLTFSTVLFSVLHDLYMFYFSCMYYVRVDKCYIRRIFPNVHELVGKRSSFPDTALA